MLIGHRSIDHETIDKIDRRRSTVLPRYRERDNSAWREFVKALARAIGEAKLVRRTIDSEGTRLLAQLL